MNCRPGEIARIIRLPHAPELEGRLVEVLRSADSSEVIHLSRFGHAWMVKALCRLTVDVTTGTGQRYRSTVPPGQELAAPDAWLRPIRPGEGEDETLAWAGKPEGVPA